MVDVPEKSHQNTNATNATGIRQSSNLRQQPRFIVTGFGPFGGVSENPTTVIVRKLQSFLEQNQNAAATKHLAALVEDCILLETSAKDVDRTCDRLQAQLFSKGVEEDGRHDSTDKYHGITILLHLGVAEGERAFRLEACAYNEATFRIPDQQGYRPQNISIFEEEEYKKCLRTNLNVDRLAQEMNNSFPDISTKVSTNPGRYVCNYIYCCSLQRFSKVDGSIFCLFLHVPPFSAVPEEQQLSYVSCLLEKLANVTIGV